MNIRTSLVVLAGLSSTGAAPLSTRQCKDICQELREPMLLDHKSTCMPDRLDLKHYRICMEGRSSAFRKLCLPMCTGEDTALTSYEACFNKRRYPKDIDSCRRGYDSILNSLDDAFQVDEIPVHVESVDTDISVEVEHDTLLIEPVVEQDTLDNDATVADDENEEPIHHEQTNVDESVHTADTSFEIEQETLNIETIAETFDNVTVFVKSGGSIYHEPNHTKDLSSSMLEEVAAQETVVRASSKFGTNSTLDLTLDLVEYPVVTSGSLVPHLKIDQIFATHTIPCLNEEMHVSSIGDNCTIGLLGYNHKTVDVSPIETAFIIIISFAMLVGCWLIFQTATSAKTRAWICLGRASTSFHTTTRSIVNGGIVLMKKLISLFRHEMYTTIGLIRLLLWPIESSLNAIITLIRWLWYMYGPNSHGRSLFDIMFKSNPKQGSPKCCKVASTFCTIVQCLIETGQASLLKLMRFPFTLARLGLALVVKTYDNIHSVVTSISGYLHIIQTSIFGMARLAQVLVITSCTLINSVVHGLTTTVQASLLELVRLLLEELCSVGHTAAKLYALVLSVATHISKAIGVYLHSIRVTIFGLDHLALKPIISYAHALSVVAPVVYETVGVCLHYFQGLIFILTLLLRDATTKSYLHVLSVQQYLLKTIGQACAFICNTTRSLSRLVTNLLTIGVFSTSSLIKLAIDSFHFVSAALLTVPRWYWKEFGPYSRGRSVFDILFKSNPKRRFKSSGQVASSRLNNIKASSSIPDQCRPWYKHKQFDPGILLTVHRIADWTMPFIIKRTTLLSTSCHILAIRRSLVGRSMNKLHIIIILAIKCLIFVGMSSALTLDNGVSAAHYPFQ